MSNRFAVSGTLAFVALCVVLGVAELRRAVQQPVVPPTDASAIQSVAAAIDAYMRREPAERPLILIDQETWHFAAGVLLQLEKAGRTFSVERDWLPMFTEDVAPSGTEKIAIMIGGAAQHYRDRSRPGNIVIAERPPIFADAIRLSP